MGNYFIQTYGCQMNYSDTERVETYLEALGYTKTPEEEDADLIVINSCSVRQKAEDRVLGQMKKMRRLRENNKNLIIALTGCMIRKSSSRYSSSRDRVFSSASELDIALRIEELPKFATLVKEIYPDMNIKQIEEEGLEDYFNITPNYTSQAQAFIPVSTGCDKFCTYCIVPFSRGREKSRHPKDIIQEAENLVEKGCKEITLIGQTVNSYGISDFDKTNPIFQELKPEPFVYLLQELDKLHEKGLRRVRFTSSHPKDITDELIDAIANLRTQMPYLHLPVQSGDNNTLKRMNRTYTIERYKEIIKKLREKIPDIAISTDVIVGFCDESEEEFENTHKFFKEMQFDHSYIAQYSVRTGTFAAKNLEDNILLKTKNKRWHCLNNLLKEVFPEKLKKFIGETVEVLVETYENGELTGRSEHYKEIQFPGEKSEIGKILKVKITDAKQWLLIGEKA